ncbi:MAG: S1C family serine protease [Treponema sp.]|jgi:S1-C subfamily serine protease|nr:S1C family serine protease [Treponema sp.]
MVNVVIQKMKHSLPISALFAAAALAGCITAAQAEKRLAPVRSTEELRLEDIRRCVPEEPVRAIHLIGVYRVVYDAAAQEAEQDQALVEELAALEKQAVRNLEAAQKLAISEKRWEDAASMARSLSSLGISVENTGMEPDLLLAEARDRLKAGDNLSAFLSAVRSHDLKPLEAGDALPFLERSVAVQQRRAASFFLSIIDRQGLGQGLAVPEDLRRFAQGQDTAADMIKGVATVLVNRGVRIQHGAGSPDWVLGSAFFVDPSGLMITNYHVIASEVDPTYEGYSRLYIRLGDSSSARFPAKVIGWDKTMDLALIKAEIQPEYVFSLVDWGAPQVGDTVLAIGSPGGLEKTVTQGIVSALGRRFLQIGDVIQIDAAINHGNSGGPVLDAGGRLVGIVFAGVEQFEGLNFAVPAERLAAALPAMLAGGKAQRPWLGLVISETNRGAEIIYVAPFTPAAERQIAEGLFITGVNGAEVSAPQGALIPSLQDRFFPGRPGELVSLTVSGGERLVLMTAPRPDMPLAEAAKKDSRERLVAPLFGLILSSSTNKGLSASYLVKKVVRGSIADEAGLSEQDPVSIRALRLEEKEGYALLDLNVKKRRMGYLETYMRLPALLDSPDTL